MPQADEQLERWVLCEMTSTLSHGNLTNLAWSWTGSGVPCDLF